MLVNDQENIVDATNEQLTVSLRIIKSTRSIAVFIQDKSRTPQEAYPLIAGKRPVIAASVPKDGFIPAANVEIVPVESLATRIESVIARVRGRGVDLDTGFINLLRPWVANNKDHLTAVAGVNRPHGQSAATMHSDVIHDNDDRGFSLNLVPKYNVLKINARDLSLPPAVAHLKIKREDLNPKAYIPRDGFFYYGEIRLNHGADVARALHDAVVILRSRGINFSAGFTDKLNTWVEANHARLNRAQVQAAPAHPNHSSAEIFLATMADAAPAPKLENPFLGTIDGDVIKDNRGELKLRLNIQPAKRRVTVFVQDPSQEPQDVQAQIYPGQTSRLADDGFVFIGDFLLHANTDVGDKLSEKITDLKRKGFVISDDLPLQAAAWVEANQDVIAPLLSGDAPRHGSEGRQAHGHGRHRH